VGDHETGAPSADGIAPQEQMQSAMEENVAAKRPGITIFSRAEHIWKQWNAWKKGIVIIGIILCVVIPYLGFLILNRPLQPVQLILPGKNPATSPINARFAAVNKVAFSPDGKTLASVSSNYGLQLWNLGDGALMNIGENSDLYAVAFSPDGKYLAGGSGVDKIKVMDTTVGTFPIKFILNGHTDYVREVAFSPDRQFIIASGSADQTVRLWHFSESSLIKTILEGHTDAVNSVSFSSDGKYLASGSSDGSIRIWRVSDGALQRTITTAYYKESVAISPVAPILASGGSDGTILWNLDDGTKIMNLDSSHSYSVAFSPDGQKLASGGLDNTVLIWRVSDGVLLDTFKGHPAGIISAFFSPGINSVAFSPDGTLVASGSGDGTIRLWKISP
jgi:WD40 repeat protein